MQALAERRKAPGQRRGAFFCFATASMSDAHSSSPDSLSALVREAVQPLLHEALAPIHKALSAPVDGLMTFNDAAAWLAVSPRTLETIVAEGDLAPILVRGQRRFTRDQLHAYIHRAARAPKTGSRRTSR